jgi:alanine racemase
MAVVKANAYGHGIGPIAQVAVEAGVSYIGVASLGELKLVRAARVDTPILLLNYLDPDSFPEAIQHHASITVMDTAVVDALQMTAAMMSATVNVHLKIDTGMHRAGCDPHQALELAKLVQAAPNLELEGIYTHLAESEAPGEQFTKEQLHVFRICLNLLQDAGIRPKLIHAANSAATIATPEAHFTMVRPGLITYGLNPFDQNHEKYSYVAENFKPVLSLSSQVVYVRSIGASETVGYGRRWKAERPSTLALLPVGYGDGWRRSPQAARQVLIRGQFAPMVGSVSMDQTVVDVTGIPDVMVGDEAVLIGAQRENQITADDVAEAYGTINYEVVTSLAERVERRYTEDEGVMYEEANRQDN